MHRLAPWLIACLASLGCGTPTQRDDTGTESEADTDTESESEADTDTDTGELEPLLVGEPNIITFPEQPMVVDVIVELSAPATGELHYGPDEDVGVFLLEPAAGEPATTLHFRLRGLLPDAADHQLELSVSAAADARTDSWTGTFATAPALPGFIAKFELDSLGTDVIDPTWRLLDLAKLFSTEPAGVFLVDDEGTTRWYIGDADDLTTTHDMFMGLQLRLDGTLSFLRRDAGFVIDEFGHTLMQVDADTIGASAGLHHDMIELPNGNFLVLGFSFMDVDYAGEGTLHVAGDMIHEFTPEGQLVWTWNAFDHLDPQRRREDFDSPMKIHNPQTGQDGHDWTHSNALVYTANDDTILLSIRHQDWIIAIDHQTGEVLWRLGDEGDFALLGGERWFFHQHAPEWQADGSLLLYDNAVGNPELPNAAVHSRAVQYALDFEAMTATEIWADDDAQFSSFAAGDADRTPAGHVLRLDSAWSDADNPDTAARLRELDPDASPNAVWTLYFPPGMFGYRALPVEHYVGQPQ